MRGRESDLVASCSLAAIMVSGSSRVHGFGFGLGLHFMHAYALSGTAGVSYAHVVGPDS